MSNLDYVESARARLWLVRKMLDETPAGGTIAPGLREVYFEADLAHSFITLSGNLYAAHRHARDARAGISSSQIDVEAFERWLEGESWTEFLGTIYDELGMAVAELSAVLDIDDSRGRSGH